jgi:curved DNA-binding protein CbpA
VNPYEVLGVEPTATDTELRRAYVALARRFHPDANPGGEDRMRAVNEAWALLGDRQRRAAWDRSHADAEAAARGFQPDDPTDDGFDPRAQPDVPYRPHTRAQRQRQGLLTMAPIVSFSGAVVAFGAGVFFDNQGLLGVGVVLFSLACIAMVAVLLLALADARRDEG